MALYRFSVRYELCDWISIVCTTIILSSCVYLILMSTQAEVFQQFSNISKSKLSRLNESFQSRPSTIANISKSCLQAISHSNSTDFKLIPFAHRWDIDKFIDLCSDEIDGFPNISSEQFSPYDNSEYKFRIDLCPKGNRIQYKDYVAVYLRMTSSPDSNETHVQFKFSILNSNEKKCNSKGNFDFNILSFC